MFIFMYIFIYVYVYMCIHIYIYIYRERERAGLSRIRSIHSSNQVPCSSKACLCCFQLFGDSSNRGMSKQYPLTVFLESPRP